MGVHLPFLCYYIHVSSSLLPLCVMNNLWPLPVSYSKPIKVSSNQEMLVAVSHCRAAICLHQAPLTDPWHGFCCILYDAWGKIREAICFCLGWISLLVLFLCVRLVLTAVLCDYRWACALTMQMLLLLAQRHMLMLESWQQRKSN